MQRLDESPVHDNVGVTALLRDPPEHGEEQVIGIVEAACIAEAAHEDAVSVAIGVTAEILEDGERLEGRIGAAGAAECVEEEV